MGHPNGRKPPNPQKVSPVWGKKPPAPTGYHGQNVNNGCAVTALVMVGGTLGIVSTAIWGAVEVLT